MFLTHFDKNYEKHPRGAFCGAITKLGVAGKILTSPKPVLLYIVKEGRGANRAAGGYITHLDPRLWL